MFGGKLWRVTLGLGTACAIGDDHLEIPLQVAYLAGSFLTVAVGDSWLKAQNYDPLTTYFGTIFGWKI